MPFDISYKKKKTKEFKQGILRLSPVPIVYKGENKFQKTYTQPKRSSNLLHQNPGPKMSSRCC